MAAKTDEKTSKQEKFSNVAMALANLLNKVGPLKVTHSQVAKSSGVSRPWIYKYIGADRDDLIRFAIEHVGKQVTEKDLDEVLSSKTDFATHITRGLERMFQNTEDYPWLLPTYFKYRGTNTSPGKFIDEVEKAYVQRQSKNIAKNFSKYSNEKANLVAEILTSFRMGLAFQWQRGDLKKKTSKEELLALVDDWLKEFLLA